MNALQTCAIIPYTAKHLEDVSLMDRLCFIDPWFKRSFIEELSAPCALNLVAISHDDAACTMGYCLGRVIVDECTINRLAVHPDYQRGGIASHILKKFLHNAGLQGAHNCFIDVRASNTAAHCLYEGHGFHRIGIRNSYYQIDAEDALLMSCAIPTAHYNKTVHQE
jgi:ribosomal-protein-alanine N-acetyltransferase